MAATTNPYRISPTYYKGLLVTSQWVSKIERIDVINEDGSASSKLKVLYNIKVESGETFNDIPGEELIKGFGLKKRISFK